MCYIFLFALAISIDGFGVGLSYGMRKIKIAVIPFFIICMSSAVAVTIAMVFGKVMASFFSERFATFLGGSIMIVIGIWIILQNYILNLATQSKNIAKIANKVTVINILKEPVQADLNNSGEIDIKEAILLGVALAMDAFGAGFGVAMSGYSLILTPIVVAITKFIMLNLGLIIGGGFSVYKFKKGVSLLPGGIIIFLGLTKLIGL
ncbi:MAG: sporulation membrane protein YtaF [Clostridia bacterium]|nr:sporulation membrane protein YtaF [Clostridia bacterium]MDD4048158.1 sporulation membrane protein YtaF [Clostridia bacterium]